MNDIRLKWEPISTVSEETLERCLLAYTNSKGGVTLLKNGTVLFIKSSGNDIEDAQKGMNEARFLTDFQVQQMDDGNYLVKFHSAVVVFVGASEFEQHKEEIANRIDELKFPSEHFLTGKNKNENNLLLGLYARGKLQRDAYHFSFLKRV